MLTKGNFLLMEKSEFKDWLKDKKVTRLINHLQVHHTYLPNYSTRKNQDAFKCLEGMRNTHLANGWSATGQHISVLETGQIAISLDRDLNVTPAGIKGHNANGVAVEIVGNFNSDGDKMTPEQKESVIHVYAYMANKFGLPIDVDHIVFHCWYTPEGKRLPDYSSSKSSKTCPGTAFFGGNTIASAKKNFLPLIQAELDKLNKKPEPVTRPTIKDDDQVEKVKIVYTKDNSLVDGFMKDGTNYVSVAALKELGLIKATWDNVNKKLYIN